MGDPDPLPLLASIPRTSPLEHPMSPWSIGRRALDHGLVTSSNDGTGIVVSRLKIRGLGLPRDLPLY
jgi:hypothetical protein